MHRFVCAICVEKIYRLSPTNTVSTLNSRIVITRQAVAAHRPAEDCSHCFRRFAQVPINIIINNHQRTTLDIVPFLRRKIKIVSFLRLSRLDANLSC